MLDGAEPTGKPAALILAMSPFVLLGLFYYGCLAGALSSYCTMTPSNAYKYAYIF